MKKIYKCLLLYWQILKKELWLILCVFVLIAMVDIEIFYGCQIFALNIFLFSYFFLLNPLFVIFMLFTNINKRCAFHVGSLIIENIFIVLYWFLCGFAVSKYSWDLMDMNSLSFNMFLSLISYVLTLLTYIVFKKLILIIEGDFNNCINHYCYHHKVWYLVI